MMTTAEKLTALRRAMVQRGLAAYLVPTDDFHASEYVGDYFKAREYLSGFTGSAGTLLILPSRALLWTDGRYFLQAESQLAGSGIELMRSGEPDVPTLERFLLAELEDILLHVVIIDESEGASNAVSIGCTVTVVDLKTGREMPPYKVVGSQEADPMHRAISEESPFGKALMGAKEGDEISVEAPVGIIHYRVEKIER